MTEAIPDLDLTNALRDDLRTAWQRYVDLLAPLRPGLHAYCRRLTRDVWDAEDLVQETLLRAFGQLGSLHQDVKNPRAYLLRTATHAWIDLLRRREKEAAAIAQGDEPVTEAPTRGGELRDAATTLMQRLAPRERAALVLKDAFDLSLEETALVLSTTVGAVKAALHRGRGRLAETDAPAPEREAPSRQLVDRFVALFNAEDKEGLIALFLDTASSETIGCGLQFGPDALQPKDSWFDGAVGGHPDWPEVFQHEAQRAEVAIYEGEPIVTIFRTRQGKERLEIVVRLEEREGRAARLRSYGFCPETMTAVAEALGLENLNPLYRFPTPAPGESF